MARQVLKFDPELLDALLVGADPKAVASSKGLFEDLKKACRTNATGRTGSSP